MSVDLVNSLADAGVDLRVIHGDRFRVTDDRQAAWAMRKLAQVRGRLDDVAAVAQAEIDRVRAWAEDQSEPLRRDAAYFEGLLGEYARTVRDDPGDGRKSVSTAHGSVSTRTIPARLEVTDVDALVAWAETARPGLVQVKKTVRASDVKGVLASYSDGDGQVFDPATGEVVPGIVGQPASVSVTFKVG